MAVYDRNFERTDLTRFVAGEATREFSPRETQRAISNHTASIVKIATPGLKADPILPRYTLNEKRNARKGLAKSNRPQASHRRPTPGRPWLERGGFVLDAPEECGPVSRFIRSGKGLLLVRRLSPPCCRIDLDDLPKSRDELGLLQAMGWETANIHLGSPENITAIKRDLTKREPNWLRDAGEEMVKAIERDWKEWKNS